jgi:hypothetical protein
VGYQWFRTNNLPNGFPAGMNLQTGGQTVVPLSGGLATYLGAAQKFNLDARFTYDLGTSSNLIGTQRADQWFASTNLGYVF